MTPLECKKCRPRATASATCLPLLLQSKSCVPFVTSCHNASCKVPPCNPSSQPPVSMCTCFGGEVPRAVRPVTVTGILGVAKRSRVVSYFSNCHIHKLESFRFTLRRVLYCAQGVGFMIQGNMMSPFPESALIQGIIEPWGLNAASCDTHPFDADRSSPVCAWCVQEACALHA